MELFTQVLELRAGKYASCTLDTCPLSDSVYGYLPNLPVSAIFVAIFVLSLTAHLFQRLKSKSWTFVLAFGIGTFAEAAGMLFCIWSIATVLNGPRTCWPYLASQRSLE